MMNKYFYTIKNYMFKNNFDNFYLIFNLLYKKQIKLKFKKAYISYIII